MRDTIVTASMLEVYYVTFQKCNVVNLRIGLCLQNVVCLCVCVCVWGGGGLRITIDIRIKISAFLTIGYIL